MSECWVYVIHVKLQHLTTYSCYVIMGLKGGSLHNVAQVGLLLLALSLVGNSLMNIEARRHSVETALFV